MEIFILKLAEYYLPKKLLNIGTVWGVEIQAP